MLFGEGWGTGQGNRQWDSQGSYCCRAGVLEAPAPSLAAWGTNSMAGQAHLALLHSTWAVWKCSNP